MKNINQEDLEKLKNNCQNVYFDEKGNFIVETDNAIINDSNIDTSIKGLFIISSEDVAKLISLKFNKTIKTIKFNKSNIFQGLLTTANDTISYILNDENLIKIFEEKDEEINKLKEEIESLKECHNKYEQEVYNQISIMTDEKYSLNRFIERLKEKVEDFNSKKRHIFKLNIKDICEELEKNQK
ncbi:hypothetical protein SJC03_28 [Bacteroides phage SJC03]|nr:hypothetical protein SJC03_28 [Bacteroides phage SJC03]